MCAYTCPLGNSQLISASFLTKSVYSSTTVRRWKITARIFQRDCAQKKYSKKSLKRSTQARLCAKKKKVVQKKDSGTTVCSVEVPLYVCDLNISTFPPDHARTQVGEQSTSKALCRFNVSLCASARWFGVIS